MYTPDNLGESGTNTERIVFFSDAVFAIAITLLALEIKPPETAPAAGAWQHLLSLLDLWPKMLSFVISFLVIGALWTAHHRIFSFIQRYDRRLIWLNLLFLLCIAFMPVPTALLGNTGDDLVSVCVYAGVLAMTGVAQWAIWHHATWRRRLVTPAAALASRRSQPHPRTAGGTLSHHSPGCL
jgi:uncharacterized membrane protein